MYPHQFHRLGVEGEIGAGKEKENAAGYCENAEEQWNAEKYEEYSPSDDYELQCNL